MQRARFGSKRVRRIPCAQSRGPRCPVPGNLQTHYQSFHCAESMWSSRSGFRSTSILRGKMVDQLHPRSSIPTKPAMMPQLCPCYSVERMSGGAESGCMRDDFVCRNPQVPSPLHLERHGQPESHHLDRLGPKHQRPLAEHRSGLVQQSQMPTLHLFPMCPCVSLFAWAFSVSAALVVEYWRARARVPLHTCCAE